MNRSSPSKSKWKSSTSNNKSIYYLSRFVIWVVLLLIGNILSAWHEQKSRRRNAIRSENSFTILAFDVLTHFDALYFRCGIYPVQVFTASRVTFFRASRHVRVRQRALVISIKGEWENIALVARHTIRNKRNMHVLTKPVLFGSLLICARCTRLFRVY